MRRMLSGVDQKPVVCGPPGLGKLMTGVGGDVIGQGYKEPFAALVHAPGSWMPVGG